MRTRTVERVENWDSRPFSGGYRELHDLADDGFTGAIVADETWLFMLNGRVVGVFEGSIDNFEDASGSVYKSPDPALPLLFSMQERGGKTQARYYTNDTPISEATDTLSDANFTGYIELSENVLSGDYYVVYYGGRSMATAFVGTSEDLVSGEEAFERADDEVGVYEVKKVAMNITDIPEPAESASTQSSAAAAGIAGETESEPADEAEPAAESETVADTESVPVSEPESDPEPESESKPEPKPESAAEPSAANGGEPAGVDTTSAATDRTAGTAEPKSTPDATADPEPDAESASTSPEPEDVSADGATTGRTERSAAEPALKSETERADTGAPADTSAGIDASTKPRPAADEPTGDTTNETAAESEREEAAPGDDVFSEEKQWRKTTSIPALDPDESRARASKSARKQARKRAQGNDEAQGSDAASAKRAQAQKQARAKKRARRDQSPQSEQSRTSQRSARRSDQAGQSDAEPQPGGSGAALERLKRAVEEREDRIEELSTQVDALETERDDLQSDLDDLRTERDQLAERVEELEADVEAAREAGAAAGSTASDLSPDEALAGTNLFVRYGSKGKPTLDALTEGDVDRTEVNANLRLDYHTQFDAAEATVDGEPFEDFLEATSAYRFVSWMVSELPYEIRDAGHRTGLSDLYEAVPSVDRIELQGAVDVSAEDGTTTRTFDVVLRDRMGDPLVVAELNDERDPVSGDEMAGLVDAASVVGEHTDDLSAAFYVTSSFFEPGALETAGEATKSGGLLSRSDKMSYVKVARKQGYHLCLVEDRNEAFHLTVPEL